MKLRQLNDLILECQQPNKFKKNTLGGIIEDRLHDLLISKRIETIDEFVSLVLADVQTQTVDVLLDIGRPDEPWQRGTDT